MAGDPDRASACSPALPPPSSSSGKGAAAEPGEWKRRVEQGAILMLEGDSPGRRGSRLPPLDQPGIEVRSVTDARAPSLAIVWERALAWPAIECPAAARILVRERWTGAPLAAGLLRRARGAVLWLAASPGERGFERFPYLPQALADLGLDPGFGPAACGPSSIPPTARGSISTTSPSAGARPAIAALHVAAWHYYEPDAERDAYLKRLIEACHRNAILVYAWLELPARQREVLGRTIRSGARRPPSARTPTSTGAS